MMEFTIDKPNSEFAITFVIYSDEDVEGLDIPERCHGVHSLEDGPHWTIYAHSGKIDNWLVIAIAHAILCYHKGSQLTDSTVNELSVDIGNATASFWEAYTKQSVEDITNE